jgi:hypothetical protein
MRALDELIEDQQRKVDDSIRYARELYASGIGIRGVARRMGISYERARLYTVGDTPVDPDALPDLRQADLAVAAPRRMPSAAPVSATSLWAITARTAAIRARAGWCRVRTSSVRPLVTYWHDGGPSIGLAPNHSTGAAEEAD